MTDQLTLEQLEELTSQELGEILLDESSKAVHNVSNINRLIDLGADPNVRCKVASKTPLTYMVIANDIDIVKKLLEIGANINIKDQYEYWTPLHWASGLGYVEIAKLLIESGASLEAQDNATCRPWDVGKYELRRELYKILDPNYIE